MDRAVDGLAAALFLFLVGLCLPMPFRGKPRPGLAEAWPRYLCRGLEIVMWGYVLNLVVFHDGPVGARRVTMRP